MSVITGRCVCGNPIPPTVGRGRPRKFCSDACRYYAKNQRSVTGWTSSSNSIAKPTDPRTYRRRSLECVVRLLDGERSTLLPEDLLAQALIEARQLAWAVRRAGAECPPPLRARAYEVAAGFERVLNQQFEGIV